MSWMENKLTNFFKNTSFFNLSLYGFTFTSPFSIAAAQTFLSLMVISWILRMILNKRIIYKKTPIDIFILIYLASQFVASLFSANSSESMVNFLNTDWIVVLYFAVVSNLDSQPLKKAVFILITASVVVGIYSIYQHYYGYEFIKGKHLKIYGGFYRGEGFFGLCLTFGGYIMAITITSIAGFFSNTSVKLKYFFGISFLILFYSVLSSYTRSSWIGVHTAGFIISAIKGYKRLFIFVSIILTFWVIIYFFHNSLITFKGFESMVDTSEDMPKSNRQRIELWNKSIDIIKDYPVFGIGIGQFESMHDKYNFSKEARFGHPHNDFLNVAVNSGLIGLVSFLIIWVIFFKNILKRYYYSLNKENLILNLKLGSAFAVSGFLIAGLFQCFYTDLETGILWWFFTALAMSTACNGTTAYKNECNIKMKNN